MRGIGGECDEWCWRDAPESVKEATEKTALSPENFRAWGLRFLDDFLEGFKGQESKLVWVNGESGVAFGREYGAAFQEFWKKAYARGCGGRDGFVENYYRYLNEGHGMRVTADGYLEAIEGFPPFENGAMWYTENEEYKVNDPNYKFGPSEHNWQRWFTSSMRALQMRRNWMCIRSEVFEHLESLNPAFARWMELSFGKTAKTTPEAWSWLRESYRPKWDRHRLVLKNFERWLLQRDVRPGGVTVPAAKTDISKLGLIRQASGRDHEFHARRTDRGTGNPSICFRLDPAFISGGPHHVLVKVTYLDGPEAEWCLEYHGTTGAARPAPVRTTGTGTWKTATLDVPDMRLAGSFTQKMDFRITALRGGDVTVRLVRLIKVKSP